LGSWSFGFRFRPLENTTFRYPTIIPVSQVALSIDYDKFVLASVDRRNPSRVLLTFSTFLNSSLDSRRDKITRMPSGATQGDLSAATEPHPDAFIRFRLSAIDSVPTWEPSPFDNRRSPYSKELLRQVPVIRIFGATDKGQRVCAHVHGTFPYVFVEYKGKLDPDSGECLFLKQSDR
jgi:hypothetical protein